MPVINGRHYPYGQVPDQSLYALNATQLRTELSIRELQGRGNEEMPKAKQTSPVEDFLNSRVSHLVRRMPSVKIGPQFGVELELEGRGLHPNLEIPGWSGHHDGSLRGESSVEWVFSKPLPFSPSLKKLDVLFKKIEESGAVIRNSYRTSTHVHLNYSDKYAYQVVTSFVVYTLLEDIIARWCGSERSGNLFCLGARDAENIVTTMSDSVFRHNNFAHFNNDLRYAGFNLCSLNKFGTIEFRTMRGVSGAEEAKQWLKILKEFYDFCINNTKSPAELLEMVSHEGARGFVGKVFSQEVAQMLLGDLTENEVYASLYEGLRLIQVFCYSISNDWRITVEYKEKPDKEVKERAEENEVGVEMNNRAMGLEEIRRARNIAFGPRFNQFNG